MDTSYQTHAKPAATYDAAPRTLALRIYKHDSVNLPLVFRQIDAAGTVDVPYDLTNHQFSAMVIENNTDTSLLLMDVDATDAKDGKLVVTVEPWEMTLQPGSYRWMLQAVTPQGHQETQVSGIFEVME